MRARAALPWLVIVAVLVGIALVAGAPTRRSDRPLDPRANGPRGAKAVVILLDELGADVDVTRGAPAAGVDRALVLRDRFDAAGRDEVERWVEGGGVLVVADPGSPLNPDDHGGVDAGAPCPAALDGVERIDVGRELRRDDGAAGVGGACFGGFVVATAVGAGTIVSIEDPIVFVNQRLGAADNAVLAAALLIPTGTERVAFLEGPAGAGEERLFDLLGPRVAQALVQVAVAFGVFVLWRGRRLGRAVVEAQPVAVAGSELVSAVGRMLGGRKQPAEAGARVRTDVRRAITRRLGLPSNTPVERIADAVAARTGLDPAAVVAALATRPLTTDADLVDVVAELDHLRDQILQGAR